MQLYGTGSQPRTRKLTIMQFEQEEPNASAETTVRISALSSDLILEIVEHLPCHVALAGLSGTCWALRRVITADVMETKVRALSDMRGWCSSHPDPDYAQVSHLTVAAPTAAGTSPLPMTQPHGWKITRRYGSRLRYASRVSSLPPPHAAWPLGSSGKFLRVGAVAGCRFASIRAAVAAAADGDTLLLSSGEFDEGAQPLEIAKGIRILGAGSAAPQDAVPCAATAAALRIPSHPPSAAAFRPWATIVRATLVATSGRGAICGLTLALPHDADPSGAAHPQAAAAAAAALGAAVAGAEDEAAPGDEASHRCFAATGNAVWQLEDCAIRGGVRCGSTAELAIVGCQVSGSGADATGVLAQGSSRLLVRASEICAHARSGVTAQQGATLWLHHCVVHGNALAGIKLMSRAPCVLSCSSVHTNGRIGVLLRDRAQGCLLGCELARNTHGAGVAAIQHARLRLVGCDLRGNDGYGLVCQHSARASVETTLVRRNGGIGIMAAQETCVSLAATTCESNGGRGLRAESRARLEILGHANRLHGNSTASAGVDHETDGGDGGGGAAGGGMGGGGMGGGGMGGGGGGGIPADDGADGGDGGVGPAAAAGLGDEPGIGSAAGTAHGPLLRAGAASRADDGSRRELMSERLRNALREEHLAHEQGAWNEERELAQEETVTDERHVGPRGEAARRESRAVKSNDWHPATRQMAWFMAGSRGGDGGAPPPAAPFTSAGWSEAMEALREEVAASLALT